MAENKRPLPPSVVSMKARKRQKLNSDCAEDTKRRATTKGSSRQKVNLDALPWQEVSLPDRLTDYEGFFGLEEIDDIEVVRDDANGRISYHATVEKTPTGTALATADSFDQQDDASSWDGFEDGNEPAKLVEHPHRQPQVKKEPKMKAKIGAKVAVNSNDAKSALNGHFDTLVEASDDEDTGVDVSEWKPLKLSPDTMAALSRCKFRKPTPIQSAVIPQTLKGHDVVGKASTGSGKTLAFGIPILERFLETASSNARQPSGRPLGLILSPTRELAHQLEQHLSSLFKGIHSSKKPSIATITGGLSLQKQQRLLKDADVVVGTPGRLWEIVSSGQGIAAALQGIQFLVIDEADRLLSEGHFREVEEILDMLDRKDSNEDEESSQAQKANTVGKSERQTLVFSATFDRGLQKKLVGKLNRKDNLLGSKETMEYLLSKLNFREEDPKFIDVNPTNQLATGLKEGLVECGGTEKDLYLYALLLLNQASRAMVFTNSISAVRRITPLLQNLNLNALALHSGMPQKARLRSVERFSQSTIASKCSPVVLVATDVAARGLDIKNIDLVVHYHLPRAADTYVHRSGRTARAGQQGASILICAPEEVAGVRRLIAKVHANSAVAKDENASNAAKQGYYIRTLDIDRRVVSRLKERASLAKKLADAVIAKEKQHKEDDFMRAAAEELGVEYDSEEFEKQASGKRGRGSGRKKKEREARELTKAELGALRANLKQLLNQRVNVGVSERYLTSGNVDIDELLRQQDAAVGGQTGDFLGTVSGIGLEDL